MNIETFLDRWNRLGKQRQLITVLMALLKKINVVEMTVDLDSLDTIGSGESLLMTINGEELIMRYCPEQTELLTIQEGQPWTNNGPSPYAKSQNSSTLTDAALAELERKQDQMRKVRETASRVRNKPLENLTDDLPPLS